MRPGHHGQPRAVVGVRPGPAPQVGLAQLGQRPVGRDVALGGRGAGTPRPGRYLARARRARAGALPAAAAARSAAAAACAASAACRAAFSDDAFDWAAASSPASLFRLPWVSFTNACCRDTAAWMATLRSFAARRSACLGHQQLVRLRPEHPGHRVVGLVRGQRLGARLGQGLAHPDLPQVGLRTVGVAEHGRHRAEAAAGLELLGGQAGHPQPAGGLLPFRLAEPGLGDLVRRRGPLLVHLGLVVALDQHLGLGLQPGQLPRWRRTACPARRRAPPGAAGPGSPPP